MGRIHRREFLSAAAVAVSGASLGTSAENTSRPHSDPARLRLGLIGCGNYGMTDVRAAFKTGGLEIVALCDVDSQHLARAATAVQKLQPSRPQTFKHYQDLLAVSGLQAVIIATPPHWHALPFLAAVQKNLDIYCEKPLAYDIREAQAMVAAAQKKDLVIQIGFQRRQSPAFRQVRDYVQQGHLGRVVQVDAQIHYTAGLRDTTPQDPPASLDWDLWCGPAPKIPYSPQVGHVAWRLEKTTGHGHLVDWGIHLIDTTRWILDLPTPRTVQAAGGLHQYRGKITTPDVLTVQFDFERCPVFWKHRIWGAREYAPEVANGIFLYGEDGTIFVTDDRWTVIPKDKNKLRVENKAAADLGTAHMAEFLQAVRTRQQPGCPIDEGYRSTAAVKLAMIAYETASKVVWDENAHTITDNPQAAALLKRAYRAPWKHPYEA
jgi:predicted dehydrogenase